LAQIAKRQQAEGIHCLINGDTDEKTKSALKDTELLQQFKAVEQMNEADRTVIKRLIDAFTTKGKIKQLAL
jgi:hypothetical protein